MRKPRATMAEISAILKDYRASGKSQKQFTEERGINCWTFRNWMLRAGKVPEPKSLPMPVISFVPSSAPPTTSGYRVEYPNGTILHIPSTVSVELILAALRGAL